MNKFISKLSSYKITKHLNILNIVIILSVFILGYKFLNLLIFNFNWELLTNNINIFLIGLYPPSQSWRPLSWICLIIVVFIISLLSKVSFRLKKASLFLWFLLIPFSILLLNGGFVLKKIPSNLISGLSLTIYISIVSYALSLPFGVVLALLREKAPKSISIFIKTYISIIRSLPLIAVLFFGQLLIPFFLPIGFEIDRIVRCIFSFTIFMSAYIAEDVRGGLQSISIKQIEAAKSLSLSESQMTFYILIPQALINSIPALTNQAIGLFQNTTLISILGLLELLGIGMSLLSNPKYISNHIEIYLILTLIYWISCYFINLLFKTIEKNMAFNS